LVIGLQHDRVVQNAWQLDVFVAAAALTNALKLNNRNQQTVANKTNLTNRCSSVVFDNKNAMADPCQRACLAGRPVPSLATN